MGDDARRQAHLRRARSSASRPTSARATRSSPTASTSSSRAPSRARRSSPRWPSSTSSTAPGASTSLVLDTPPSRNALDFLDAPDRLTGFLEGRALRVFLAPTGLAAKVVGRGTSVVFSVLKRLTGVDLLDDLSVFFRALGGLVDGFKERAAGVKALLADDATTFIVITSPEREPVEEAIFFTRQAARARACRSAASSSTACTRSTAGRPRPTSRRSTAALGGDAKLAGKVARAYAEERALAERDGAAIEHLRAETGEKDPIVIPQLDGDVHDVDGLVAIHAPPVRGLGRATGTARRDRSQSRLALSGSRA